MKINPFVSVLVANYNKEKYINRCLKSLKKQTYKNFEVIFFDDNSSDNSIYEVKKILMSLILKLLQIIKEKVNMALLTKLIQFIILIKTHQVK